jgi:hypothetical protein
MARSSSEGFDQWVFAIDRRRHVPHGKTDLLNDLLARSDGSALTTLLCSASGIFAMGSNRICITIMRGARTFPWTRIRPYRALLRGQGVLFAVRSSADCITNMVRQEKPDASSGRNSRLGKGNEPPHRESSLGLMEVTT